MALFSLVDLSLSASLFKYSLSVNAIGCLGGAGSVGAGELGVPWQDLQDDPDTFSLLSWHSRLSEFTGRDQEMTQLKDWCQSNPAVSVKFVCGEGGVGKSRLAAQFADQMRGQKWSAGFVNLRKPSAFKMRRRGSLLVVDYPEEHLAPVKELMADLAGLGNGHRVRVLFLTRREHDFWTDLFFESRAMPLIDQRPLVLCHPDPEAAREIYNSANKRAAEILGKDRQWLTGEEAQTWLAQSPENGNPLFVLGAAVHQTLHDEAPERRYHGSEVIQDLVLRELDRLTHMAQARGLADPLTLARVVALAAFADELTLAFVEDNKVLLGFKPAEDVQAALKYTGLCYDKVVKAPRPDLFAAALVVHVLGQDPTAAPERLWAALALDLENNLERLARLGYDAGIRLGLGDALSDWLASALRSNVARCREIQPVLIATIKPLPLSWCKGTVACWQTLCEVEDDEVKKGNLLYNFSTDLAAIGERVGALKAIEMAVDIQRRLVQTNSSSIEPVLASSLNNLSNRLADMGNKAGALKAIEEAVSIRRRLVQINPSQFESDLAGSLNNLSNRLADMGNHVGALKAIEEAVTIRRRLAQNGSLRFEFVFAGSLNNLSIRLADTGDPVGALNAIQEAVTIRRRLALTQSSRFEPDLARSLAVLGDRYFDMVMFTKAIEAYEESLALLKVYAGQYPESQWGNLYEETQRYLRRARERAGQGPG